MQMAHDLRQVLQGEIIRPHPGIESRQAKVNGIGTVLDCRSQAFPVTGGCKEFGTLGQCVDGF